MNVSLILDPKLLSGAKHTVKSLLLLSVSICVRTREKNLCWENVTVSATDVFDVEPRQAREPGFRYFSITEPADHPRTSCLLLCTYN